MGIATVWLDNFKMHIIHARNSFNDFYFFLLFILKFNIKHLLYTTYYLKNK